jgi:hypothetical protein
VPPIVVQDRRLEIDVGSPIPVGIVVSRTWPELSSELAEMRQVIRDHRIEISLCATPLELAFQPGALGGAFRTMLLVHASCCLRAGPSDDPRSRGGVRLAAGTLVSGVGAGSNPARRLAARAVEAGGCNVGVTYQVR